MHQPEPALFLNLVMIEKDDQVLIENRRKQDWPGWTFPGGHVEAHESFVKAAIREVHEETGLTISNLDLAGLCQYQDVNKAQQKFRRVIYFYRTQHFTGQLQPSRKGDVFWLPKKELKQHQLAGSLADFLHVFEHPDLSEVLYLDADSAALFY